MRRSAASLLPRLLAVASEAPLALHPAGIALLPRLAVAGAETSWCQQHGLPNATALRTFRSCAAACHSALVESLG